MDLSEISQIIVIIILGTLGITFFSIFSGLLFNGIERKLYAFIKKEKDQSIIQPLKDIKQLFSEKSKIPKDSIPWLFNLMPMLGLAISISILIYLPIGSFPPIAPTGGDIILVLYLLIMSSLTIIIGGFSTGMSTTTKGAHKEMENLIAYLFPLVVIIISFVWKLTQAAEVFELTDIFSISTIAGLNTNLAIWNYLNGPLGYIGFAILLFVFVLVTTSDFAKFHINPLKGKKKSINEALSGYSGRNLGLFFIMNSVKTIVVASLIVTLFFPYNLSNLLDMVGSYPGYAIDFIFYLIKIFLVMIISITLLRIAIARLKIEQIVFKYWVQLTLASLVGLILVMWDGWLMNLLNL